MIIRIFNIFDVSSGEVDSFLRGMTNVII